MTSVPAPYFGPLGFVAPDESAILAGVAADIGAAFDQNLNPDPTTPQGQLAVSFAAVIGFCNDVFLAYTNGVDPSYATGRMQDAIARLYFLTRDPAEPTSVIGRCYGLYRTPIPAGSLAKAADGNTYQTTVDAIIGAIGYVDIPFACLATGPIACPPTSLNTVFRGIAGWDSVTNPDAGILGRDAEDPSAFEKRRAASVAINAVGTLPAIRANVLAVPNVLDAYVDENPTAAPVTKGGVTIPPHSLYVAVAGGAPADVAFAIWRKKAPGSGTSGNTTVQVVDDNSGYAAPKPQYAISFDIATPTPIQFAIVIAASDQVPSDAQAQIQAVVQAAFAGTDGGPRAQIGATLYASRFYAGIAKLGPWAQIVSIELQKDGAGGFFPTVLLDINEDPTVTAADVVVTTL